MAKQKTIYEFSKLLDLNLSEPIWYPVWKYLSSWQQNSEKEDSIALAGMYFEQYGQTLNLGQALNLEERRKRCESLLFIANKSKEIGELQHWLPDILAAFLFYEDYKNYSYPQYISNELIPVSNVIELHRRLENLLQQCASSELLMKAKYAYSTRISEKGYYWDLMCGTPHEDDDWMEQFSEYSEININVFAHATLLWTDDIVSFCIQNTTIDFLEICRCLLRCENNKLSLEICAYDTNLEELPVGCGHFINLDSLKLNISGIELLSPDISRLKSLRYLNIESMQQHQSLFPDFNGLDSVEELSFYLCNFSEIPPSIFNLHKIKKLNIDASYSPSKIFTISSNINKLYQLKELKISHSSLDKLPDEIGDLLLLESFCLYCIMLTQLPKTIGNLGNLKKLHLYGCTRLTNLPDSLSLLTNLRTLSITELRISYIPSVLFKMSFLQSLQLECGAFEKEINSLRKALPNTIINFTKLNI